MKSIVTLLITIAIISIQFTPAQAQSESLERELAIAESILTEIFKSPSQQPIPAIFGRVGIVSTEYIPRYGVHISIGENISARSIRVSGTVQIQRRDVSEETLESNSTSESVEKKIMEYITQYASSMRSLSDNEVLRISYGLRRTADGSIAIITGLQEYTMDTPKLSFVIKSDDLRRFREGQINESQLRDRVEKQNLSEMESKRDLNIFASVLEATINNTDSKHLKVNRKPTYEYLPGLGAHFHVNVNSGGGFSLANIRGMTQRIDSMADSLNLNDVNIQIDLGDISAGTSYDELNFQSPRIEFRNDSLRVAIRGMSDSLRVHSNELRGQIEVIREQAEVARRQGREIQQQVAFRFAERDTLDLTAETSKLMAELKTTIKDYGSTLSSLGDNEMLMITINWQGRNPTVPERTHIKISKSDLMRGVEPNIEEIRRR